MSEFVDRKGTNLNKRRLKVVQVERDTTTDEISELYVEEFRNDSVGLITEGTPLDAENLTTCIQKIVLTEVYNQLNKTDEGRVNIDSMSINIASTVTSSFTLDSKGDQGSTIRWSVYQGTGISIVGNNAVVTRGFTDSDVVLKATISYNLYSMDKYFQVTVLAKEMTDEERATEDANAISIPNSVIDSFELPSVGLYGSTITWSVYQGTSIEIVGNEAIVTTDIYQRAVKLEASVKYNEAVVTKYFDVMVEAVEEIEKITGFFPNTFSHTFTQTRGTCKKANLTIGSDDTRAIYVEVENANDDFICVTIKTNSSNLVSLLIEETLELNSAVGIDSEVFEFYVHVYLDSDRSEKLGTLTGTITYIGESTSSGD